MLSPKRTKYRKYHRGRMRGTKTRGNEICFGNFGLQDIQSVVQNYGFEFSQIKRSQLVLLNQEWDLVKGR